MLVVMTWYTDDMIVYRLFVTIVRDDDVAFSIIYCLVETNGNTTDSSSFSSLSTSAAVTVASPWVRRVQYLIGYGT